jgi:hypothetical protein
LNKSYEYFFAEGKLGSVRDEFSFSILLIFYFSLEKMKSRQQQNFSIFVLFLEFVEFSMLHKA